PRPSASASASISRDLIPARRDSRGSGPGVPAARRDSTPAGPSPPLPERRARLPDPLPSPAGHRGPRVSARFARQVPPSRGFSSRARARITALAVLAGLVPAPHAHAGPPAGTPIDNTATAALVDASGVPHTQSSNTVRAI